MPYDGRDCYYQDLSPLYQAWTEHYTAKGCHPMKAKAVAFKRVQRKRTWPPA